MRLYSKKDNRIINFALVVACMLFGKQLTDGFDMAGSVIAWSLIMDVIIFMFASAKV